MVRKLMDYSPLVSDGRMHAFMIFGSSIHVRDPRPRIVRHRALARGVE
jgi:hypothetical protein